MPYPSQFTREQLIETARALFEQHSYESVSMAQVAEALGIKAPSLYKHVADKTTLLREVNTLTLQELTEVLHTALQKAATPYKQCFLMGQAYWDYANAHPVTYELAFMHQYHAMPDPQLNERLARPVQAVFARAVGEEASLDALRGAWAFLHGCVVLSLGDHFRRDGKFNYERAWHAYLTGWGLRADD